MQILQEIIVTILLAYIAFTNSLAEVLLSFVTSSSPISMEERTLPNDPTDTTLTSLPNTRSFPIPDILLRSAAYQQAAVSTALVTTSFGTTRDPLDALVNIFCTFITDRQIRTTTGSGYFVHRDGVILTNAHVAQYLLLEGTDRYSSAECVVRTGNPAENRYRAELLYLSPAWIIQNASLIDDATPMGTGERDYALLLVTQSLSNEPLPAQFPALEISTALLPTSSKGQSVLAAGYPASELLAAGANSPLIPRQAQTSITELYTFGSNYADVFSVRGTEVGAAGASGGPITTLIGDSIGLIVTRGDDTSDGAGSLRAITLSHIDRTITEETGFSLAKNISGNLLYRSQIFRQVMTPFLLTVLEQNNSF